MENKTNSKKPALSNILVLVFSLFCSLLLWVYVTELDSDDYSDSFSNVAVTFDGESTMRDARGLVITSVDQTSVRFTLTGNRRAISRLDRADLTARVDLGSITSTGRYTVPYTVGFPNGVSGEGITATGKYPETVTFVVDRLSSRAVDLTGQFIGSTAEGFSSEPLQFSSETVIINGPQQALDAVDCAYVEIDRENVDRTLVLESSYVLLDRDGNVIEDDSITLESQTVTVTLPVKVIKDVDLTVWFINGGGATEDNVANLRVLPEQVTLSGDADVLKDCNNIRVATVDLGVVDGNYSNSFELTIPNGAEIISGQTSVDVSFEIKGLEKKTFTVDNIVAGNVPEGVKADVLTEDLEITVRGSAAALANVTANNIRVVGDMTDYSTNGIQRIPVEVYIDGVDGVGALGEYMIYVNVGSASAGEE